MKVEPEPVEAPLHGELLDSPKSELSLLSKNNLLPTRCTMMSQELTERVQHISVARMASVANTLPWVFASCGDGECCRHHGDDQLTGESA